MRENWIEVITGAVVLIVAAVFVLFAVGGTLGGDSAGAYPLKASFTSVEGVSVGTDVRMAGVKIGTVTAMELNTTTFRADVTFTVTPDIVIPDDSSVLISSEGLLGGSFLEVQAGGSPFDLEAGGEVIDTQSSVSLITLLMRFVGGNE